MFNRVAAAIIHQKLCHLGHPHSKGEVENLQSFVGDSCEVLRHCIMVGLEQDLRDCEVGYVDCGIDSWRCCSGSHFGFPPLSFVTSVDADLRLYGMFENDNRKLLSILLGAEPLNCSLQLVSRVGLKDVIEVVTRSDGTKIGSAKDLLGSCVVSGLVLLQLPNCVDLRTGGLVGGVDHDLDICGLQKSSL